MITVTPTQEDRSRCSLWNAGTPEFCTTRSLFDREAPIVFEVLIGNSRSFLCFAHLARLERSVAEGIKVAPGLRTHFFQERAANGTVLWAGGGGVPQPVSKVPQVAELAHLMYDYGHQDRGREVEALNLAIAKLRLRAIDVVKAEEVGDLSSTKLVADAIDQLRDALVAIGWEEPVPKA